jgi:hypothetical protein
MRAGLITIFLTFIFNVQNALAVDRIYIGSGDASCGEWIAEKHMLTHRQLWVLGYLSGLNKKSPVDFLKDYEVKGISLAIDNYCQQNPLKKVINAADDVAEQMLRMKK